MNSITKNKKKAKQRIMIIDWKWKSLPLKLNDKVLEKPENQQYLQDFTLGKGKFYNVYEVIDTKDFKKLPEDIEPLKNGDLVITTWIFNGEKTIDILEQIVKKYNKNNPEIYLLLHRGEDFEHEDVKILLNRIKPIDKIFLFAYGRDHLYYRTKNIGLINDVGDFHKGWEFDEELEKEVFIQVANEERKLVKYEYFDRVWNYYRLEFKRKLSQLEGLVFKECMALFIGSEIEAMPKEAFIFKIEHGALAKKHLYIRIKSLLGVYDNLKTLSFEAAEPLEKELEILANYEKTMETSLIFDDVRENLEHYENAKEKQVSHHFDQLIIKLKPIFLKNHGNKTTITIKDMQEVSQAFKSLRNKIIGENM